MPQLISLIDKLPYGKKNYTKGESFEASDRHADLLVKVGKARLSTAESHKNLNLPKEAKTIRKPVVEAVEDESPKPKRAYHRRDMTAEEPTAYLKWTAEEVVPMAGPTGADEPSQS
jgi:hypothetical protein